MSDVVVRPLRFTDRVAEMRAFLEALGLHARLESASGGWVDMLAGRGMVALHDAASSSTGGKPGQTRLSFEAEDIGRLKDLLESAGYGDVAIWDEAYGRVLKVSGPAGESLWIDERSDDLYGYKLNEGVPDERVTLTPLLDATHQAEWRKLLTVLGLADGFRFGSPGDEVRLEFVTTEALDDVLQRLSGYEVIRSYDTLEITDPDGQPVMVHG
ncbi:VOC family protein [Kribbella antibiotica]|uniref:VOC family protein n=1 Tax=Kribbella antibiotica TaxID=190195 RepID=A0A4R4YT52_9ACTN|nr:VOC family protein [Kribbella antibiotica]TDD48485.1 VOC family protein [Kribbella antibiotica]